MKVVIPGGSGQVGTVLARAFQADGHDVAVLSRRPDARPWRVVAWNGETLGNWQREIDGCDVVINLTGRSVNCRYTAAHREEILQSRVLSTRVVGQAIATAARRPRVWLQASTATIYAHRYDSPNDGVHYQDFVAAVRWLIERDDIDGVVNVAAPNPLPNAEFMQVLREACGVPFGLPANTWMLEIGAVFMRTETELILKSRRVVPARLLEHGFEFTYPVWRSAARDLCHQWGVLHDKARAA